MSSRGSNFPDGDGIGEQESKMPRLSLACDQCRRRKVRCDVQQPKCHNCDLRGENCKTTDLRNPDAIYASRRRADTRQHHRAKAAEARAAAKRATHERRNSGCNSVPSTQDHVRRIMGPPSNDEARREDHDLTCVDSNNATSVASLNYGTAPPSAHWTAASDDNCSTGSPFVPSQASTESSRAITWIERGYRVSNREIAANNGTVDTTASPDVHQENSEQEGQQMDSVVLADETSTRVKVSSTSRGYLSANNCDTFERCALICRSVHGWKQYAVPVRPRGSTYESIWILAYESTLSTCDALQ